MLASLTASRLSLAETSKSNLSRLIARLEKVVSEIPPPISKHGAGLNGQGLDEEEGGSEDEDPTELFHRDIGIQTSLPPSPSLSHSLSQASTPPTCTNQTMSQISSLQRLNSSLTTLLEDSISEDHEITEIDDTISILKEYLEGISAGPIYGLGGSSGNYGVGSGIYAVAGGNGGAGKEEDEISRVKAGIRGVKGVLLNARSFPGAPRGAAVGASR